MFDQTILERNKRDGVPGRVERGGGRGEVVTIAITLDL